MTVKPEKKFPVKWEYIAAALCLVWGAWLLISPGGRTTAPIANPTVSMILGTVFIIIAALIGYRGTKRKEE